MEQYFAYANEGNGKKHIHGLLICSTLLLM